MIERLKDRKLVQWAVAYLAGAWLALQVLDILGDKFVWPLALQQGLIILLAFGLPITLVLAWFHGERGRQRVSGVELLMVAGLLGAAAVVLTVWDPAPTAEQAPGERPARLALDEGPAVAVLPFVAQGEPDPESVAFAQGIHSDLITQLSKISALSVISATSVAGYAGTTRSLVDIGRELSVDAILQGSVQRAGERVRVNVQLIDARTDSHLWAESYDRPLAVSEILAIQGEISRLVVRSLAGALTTEEESRIAGPTTDDLSAFDYVAQARLLLPQRSLPNHREAERLLREAIAVDSSYAAAWGTMSAATVLGVMRHGDPLELADTAEVYAERALALDPDDADAYRALGLVAFVRGQTREGLEYSLAAVEREPSNQSAVNNVGVAYHDIGRFDEAMRWIRRSVRLAPTVTFLRTNIGGIYIHLGEFELAKERLREVVRLAPGGADVTSQLISLYRASGEPDSLIAVARDIVERSPGDPGAHHSYAAAALDTRRFDLARDQNAESLRISPDGLLKEEDTHTAIMIRAFLLLRDGRDGSARELFGRERTRLEGLIEEGGDGPWIYWELGSIHAALGEVDEAVIDLEAAFEAGWREPGWARLDPLLDRVRDDPRFRDVLDRADADIAAMRERVAREETALGLRP